jgi:colicin import membrane protein
MLRKHENSDSWKAGALAILVHAVLLVAMLISFNWKAAHTVLNVTEVELWDKIPKSNLPEIKVEPKPIIEEKPEPKPEPKPIIEEKPKPEEPKELEQKELEQKLKLKELDELRKKEALDKIKKEAREDELREKKTAEKKINDDKLRKLKEDMLNENGADDAKASSAANASEIGKFKAKIQAKIKANVNKALCGDGNPELKFSIGLMPTGELTGTPKLTKPSGIDACDEAVERAIIGSQPLPLPSDPSLFSSFRNLNLSFTPNKE